MDKRCGGCRFFRAGETRGASTYGTCRLGKVMGVFSDELRGCPSFSRKGEVAVVSNAPRRTPSRRRTSTASGPAFRVGPVAESALHAAVSTLEPHALKAALRALIDRSTLLESTSIGQGWTDGILYLSPENSELKSKEIPLDLLFNKLMMIREQLRVLEQKLNGCDGLQRSEKLDLHRRLALVRRALLDVANGWLKPASDVPLLDALMRESVTTQLALPFPDLGQKWLGGQATFTAGEETTAEPVEHFFLRVVVLRDRLSAFEAELEARPAISRADGSAMAGHLRRCHGSLTTFNALFADRADYFSSSR